MGKMSLEEDILVDLTEDAGYSTGLSALVDIDYERVRKKCYHCFRLSHEKQRCPLSNVVPPGFQRQHSTNLVETIMPMLAPTIPPGFRPHHNIVAPEVFKQMQLYMDCVDPEERRLRETRMKQTLPEFSKDPIAQCACLRMENQPIISPTLNTNMGRVFDFRHSDQEKIISEKEDNSNDYSPPDKQRLMGTYPMNGDDGRILALPKSSVAGTKKKRASWTRRQQTQIPKKAVEADVEKEIRDTECDRNTKRKATEEGKVSSKIYKQADGLMVHQKPSAQVVWNKLQEIGEHRSGGWFLVGDFNEIMNNGEKLGGAIRQESTFFPFQVPSSGNTLSWGGVREIITNGVKENVWVQCRLDRAFGNAEWFRLFPRAHSSYLEKLGSDHRPIFTGLAKSKQGRTGRFCFDKRWCAKPEVLEIIRKGWNMHGSGSGERVTDRIRSCRKALLRWKRTSDSNSKKRILQIRRNIEKEEAKLFPDLRLLSDMKVEIEKAFKEEESFWKEKKQKHMA
ncbi:hypothetical protein Bca4012_020847 [Brassica carinata]|uniref:Endonuclease/exonuclease/phosphatase domain-containing protein n=1 Tax=Brassica carinata TaxID=52824 RepID=A0A8X8BC10_BRACI|nr:hypothetical protein Bca52824_000785 [Brassica carinata]